MKRDMEWEWECDSCHRSDIPLAPMLLDDVWAQLAGERQILCANCMFKRANARSVYLELSSLKPCPFNLFHWPRSFFNFFAKGTPPPTRMPPEWREVWNELHTIQCMVGDQVRRIDRGLYLDEIWQLEEQCRAQGLTGPAFDAAVEAALPQRLAQAIDEAAKGVSTARSHRAIVVQR